jgi:hypothetical protein
MMLYISRGLGERERASGATRFKLSSILEIIS